MEGKYVAYYRVSTAKQGSSGLGLDAQKEAVKRYLNGGNWELLQEFTEVETGKGSNALSKRPHLRAAIEFARKNKAKLLIAKLDRLARNVHFISTLMEQKVKFVACDFPEANELTIHILSAMAQHEAKIISQRTKAALQIKKELLAKEGKKLGNPKLKADNDKRLIEAKEFAENLRPTLDAFKTSGMSQRAMVNELNKLGVPTAREGEWSLVQLQRVLSRLS
ncbi:MAG TPA: recombinase family protein [Verrucomicrobiae bacterium]|nr:recombinase family protein [Verrucomicrobiae bacterium]